MTSPSVLACPNDRQRQAASRRVAVSDSMRCFIACLYDQHRPLRGRRHVSRGPAAARPGLWVCPPPAWTTRCWRAEGYTAYLRGRRAPHGNCTAVSLHAWATRPQRRQHHRVSRPAPATSTNASAKLRPGVPGQRRTGRPVWRPAGPHPHPGRKYLEIAGRQDRSLAADLYRLPQFVQIEVRGDEGRVAEQAPAGQRAAEAEGRARSP